MRVFVYSLIISLIIILFPQQNQGQTIIESDSLALISFYEATNGSNWLESWDINLPVSFWGGVMYDQGRVTGLRILSNDLQGSLPESLGDLTKLEILDLGNNRLYGPLPYSIPTLRNLSVLRLNDNSLSGNIPGSLSNLTQLRFLILGRNQFTGNLPYELGRLANLEVLDFTGNQLYGEIPNEYGNFQRIHTFLASNNQLEGTIPDSFMNYQRRLRAFDLSNNLIEPSVLDKWNRIFYKF